MVSALSERGVGLWLVELEDAGDSQQWYWELLSADERERHDRFHFEKDRVAFRTARALARTALSVHRDVDPRDWRFRVNRYGKPAIEQPTAACDLRFNVSHTEGMVVCLVGRDVEVGVDVENIARSGHLDEVAESSFSPLEVRGLRSLPPGEQRERFFEYWTLKEAYIKARGMGLSLQLQLFSFHLSEHAPPRISFAPGVDDEPDRWLFHQFRPTENHLVATAVWAGRPMEVPIRLHRGMPGLV